MTERSSPSRVSTNDPADERLSAGGRVATDMRVVDGSEDGDEAADAIAATVARNLRRLRTSRGHSLERLARLSGVSRAMLGQIETSKSVPTIAVLDKIARALGVPIGRIVVDLRRPRTVVLRSEETRVVTAHEGRFTARALVPPGGDGRVAFWEIRLAPRHEEVEAPRRTGTVETLVVVSGLLEVQIGNETIRCLKPGDSITFEADVGHVYRNPSAALSIAHLVVSAPPAHEG